MEKKDLVKGKKYRHPLFNFDLSYGGDCKDYVYFYRNRENGTCTSITLDKDEQKQLTKVREKIKIECDVWINVNPAGDDFRTNTLMDKTFNLDTFGYIYLEESSAINDGPPSYSELRKKYKPMKFKATFEEVDNDFE
jgi:hypothetical protein